MEIQLHVNGSEIEKLSFPVNPASALPAILLVPHNDSAGRRMGCLSFHVGLDGKYELFGYRPYDEYVVNLMTSQELGEDH